MVGMVDESPKGPGFDFYDLQKMSIHFDKIKLKWWRIIASTVLLVP